MTSEAATESALALLREAAQAYHAGDLETAARRCAGALELSPAHAGGRNLAGMVAYLRGDHQDALVHLQQAVATDPDQAEYRRNLALVLIALQRTAEALTQLERALALTPEDLQARELRAQLRRMQQDWPGAARDYRALLAHRPDYAPAQVGLVSVLDQLKLDAGAGEWAAELARCLDFQYVEPNLLALPLSRFIRNRHGITGTRWQASLDAILGDDLLRQALNTLYFTDPAMEHFLTTLRRRLFEACREQGRVPAHWQPLLFALARHNLRNEYVHGESNAEADAVAGVSDRLAEQLRGRAPEPSRLMGAMLLVALYRPLKDQPGAEALRAIAPSAWPERARALLQAALHEPVADRALAREVAALGTAARGSGARVQAMYEANPYPRWDRLGPVTPGTVAQRLRAQIPGHQPPTWAGGDKVQVLIAGAGTGRHALRAACDYRNAEVLGVDLSLASLAYAERKRRVLGVDNLELMQANLFDLPQLERRFHVIETIGTLETLDDPEQGWEVLKGLLAEDGLMYVGSYSEVARQPVVAARKRIRELGLSGTPGDMRAFRQRIFAGELGAAGEKLTRTGDFYSLSGCRDLLFHVSERRFRLRELQAIWERQGLRFLGFHPLPPALRQAYQERYPGDPRMVALDHWIDFEESEPERFGELMGLSMFYYWLQAS